MSTRCLIAENAGGRVYAVGRIGFDQGAQDVGGVYTGLLRSDPLSPDGEGAYTHFRRVQIRVRHTGSFVCAVRLYVDGVQTEVYTGSTLGDQEVTFTEAAPVFYPT